MMKSTNNAFLRTYPRH